MMDTSPTVTLVETHTRKERKNVAHSITEEPSTILLEYTFRTDSVNCQNSIQAGFGGGRLETTVKDLHPLVANLSDFATVEVHIGNTVDVTNLSIIEAPILLSGDGGVHQAFDFTHGVNPSTTNVV